MDIVLSEKDVARFWSKVDRRGPDECWLWTAGKQEHGHGQMFLRDSTPRTVKAHRISYFLENGVQPGALHVLHTCPGRDNPSCVNPTHLRLGTQADNNHDTNTRTPGYQARGEAARKSNLTEAKVREIRKKRSQGRTLKSLSEEYSVSLRAIHYIVTRKHWTHVE